MSNIKLEINNTPHKINFEVKSLFQNPDSSGEAAITKSDGYLTWSSAGSEWVWKDESYSLTTHNHDSAYSAINHNHDLSYAPITHTHETSDINNFAEAVDDRVSSLLQAGTNITLNYDDEANTLTINSTASGGGGDGWTYVYLNEDFIVNNGANYLHLTPFYIPIPPNSNYEIETTLLFTTTLTTDGLGLTTEFSGMDGTNRSNITASLTSTQSKNWGSSGYNNNVTSTSIAGLNIALLSSFIFNNNIYSPIYKILARQNITNGTSVVTIKIGSFVKYRTIG